LPGSDTILFNQIEKFLKGKPVRLAVQIFFSTGGDSFFSSNYLPLAESDSFSIVYDPKASAIVFQETVIPDIEYFREKILLLRRLAVRNILLFDQDSRRTHQEYCGCVISDHINLSGRNPLIGENDECVGTRFPDMSAAYNSEITEMILRCAKKVDIRLEKGVLLASRDSEDFTELERRAVDLGPVSVVSEKIAYGTIAAVHAGLQVGAVVFYGTAAGTTALGLLPACISTVAAI